MYFLLLLLLQRIYVIQSVSFPVFVRNPNGDSPILVDVGSEGTVADIKQALVHLPAFANPATYVITFGKTPLADGQLLSDAGIAAESTVDVEFFGPNVRNLRAKRFNQPEITHFIDTLDKHPGNVYVAFWANSVSDDTKLHFVKRDCMNKYGHYCMDADDWFRENGTKILNDFIQGCERVTEGNGPILGKQYQFEASNNSHDHDVGVSVGDCRGSMFRYISCMPMKIAAKVAKRCFGVTLPSWLCRDCMTCRARMLINDPEIGNSVLSHLDAEFSATKMVARAGYICCALLSYPTARILTNNGAAKWQVAIAKLSSPALACTNYWFPSMTFKKKVAVSLCMVSVQGVASERLMGWFFGALRNHFTPDTFCENDPLRVPE